VQLDEDEDVELLYHVREWLSRVDKILEGCELFWTSLGFVGVATEKVQAEDIVVVPFGASVPFILRKTQIRHKGEKTYTLVDGCIVNGIMRGELMEAYDAGKISSETFTIL